MFAQECNTMLQKSDPILYCILPRNILAIYHPLGLYKKKKKGKKKFFLRCTDEVDDI